MDVYRQHDMHLGYYFKSADNSQLDIYVHGLDDSSEIFTRLFLDSPYTSCAYDQYGRGHTPYKKYTNNMYEQQLAMFIAAMQTRTGISHVNLIGFSFGAAVVSNYLARSIHLYHTGTFTAVLIAPAGRSFRRYNTLKILQTFSPLLDSMWFYRRLYKGSRAQNGIPRMVDMSPMGGPQYDEAIVDILENYDFSQTERNINYVDGVSPGHISVIIDKNDQIVDAVGLQSRINQPISIVDKGNGHHLPEMLDYGEISV